MAINDVASLLQHVRWAVQVEHSTIPPYLYAYYSLKNPASPAAQLIRSVVVEEMLHVALTCNLLNALGESPNLDDPAFLPTYPAPLPHHNPDPPLIIPLQPCSKELIQSVFMRIELPEPHPAVPEDDNYDTLGQFYAAVRKGLNDLYKTTPNLFCGDPSKQVVQIYTTGPEGQIVDVTGLSSAMDAISEIVDQGEGSDPSEFTSSDDHELAHYWKFREIVAGLVPFDPARDVYPLVTNPSTANLPQGPLRELSQLFNDCYCLLLRTLTRIFAVGNGSVLVQHGVIFTLMQYVLRPIAELLVQTPISGTGKNAGPTFEYSTTPQAQILERCERLSRTYHSLVQVHDELESLPPIDVA